MDRPHENWLISINLRRNNDEWLLEYHVRKLGNYMAELNTKNTMTMNETNDLKVNLQGLMHELVCGNQLEHPLFRSREHWLKMLEDDSQIPVKFDYLLITRKRPCNCSARS